ncbi:MAG: class I SAM-dependent methyltransferase [Actinobacteria bacterium]|nr:MAG: class I SAM-dependent methyltransferase [Actinomycetota bacterium]REK41011.1 MAG: class I SAM-dependent methyltransferase [Actinomycetota bacterium]
MGLGDCRFCGSRLTIEMVDLGMHPLCESFLTAEQLDTMEPFYPLDVRVCPECYLAQIGEYVPPEAIFDDYAYYSSFSSAWLEHARQYVDMMTDRFELGDDTRVLEIASNDGYLLQYFQKLGMNVLGVEPSSNVAAAAEEKGIDSIVEFFDASLAGRLKSEGFAADVVVANNVLAHTPHINSFVAGIPEVLADRGVATFEFPHILRLIEGNQFDTIYHEHWSYLSLATTQKIMAAHGLSVFDVEELWTHGGSLRLFVDRAGSESRRVSPAVDELLEREHAFGLLGPDVYESFGDRVKATKRKLLKLLIEAKDAGASIVIYGAAGKGNTLLNYCGIGTDFIDYACDLNPYKHGRFTPGTHIPIFGPERIRETKPDFLLLLPWNIKEELMSQLSYIGEWGGKFIVPIPEARILETAS